jgi:hypothetical protein
MKLRPLGCALCLIGALVAPSWAQDAPPVDIHQVRELLKQIKDRRATDEKIAQIKLLQDFRGAAANNSAAISFYTQAVQATQFDGKAHEQTAFQDWKRSEGEKLKSEEAQSAVRIHLNYLFLTLQRAMGTPVQQLEPALQAHIASVAAAFAKDDEITLRRQRAKEMAERNPALRGKKSPADDDVLFSDQPLTKQAIGNSIFVQWYGIQKLVSSIKDWEPVSSNVDGITQNTLLPYYRQNKDPKVLAIWDAKIQRESQQASNSNLAFKIEQFNKVRLPSLLWSRASDAVAIGLRNRGISEMLGLIKNNPEHPDLPVWIGKLEEVIAAEPAAAPANPTPAPAVK